MEEFWIPGMSYSYQKLELNTVIMKGSKFFIFEMKKSSNQMGSYFLLGEKQRSFSLILSRDQGFETKLPTMLPSATIV